MNRRDVLGLSGTLALAGLAGCLTNPVGDGEDPEGDGPQPGDDDPGGDGDRGEAPELVDSSFEVKDSGPGDEDGNRAEVSFDDVVTVEGYIIGRNGCYTAELDNADAGTGGLRMLVRAYEDEDAGDMCTQGLVEIHYEATFEFEGELPANVAVEHDSMDEVRTVAEAARDEASDDGY